VINSYAIDLILTEGDIVIGVCSSLDIQNLNFVDELLSGIPLSTAKLNKY